MSPTASAGRGKAGLLRLRELNPGPSFPREVLWSFLDTLQVGGCTEATGASNAFCEDPAPRGVGCRHGGQCVDPQRNWVGQLEMDVGIQIPMVITTCSLQGFILGLPTIFPQGFKVILCFGSPVLVVGQERELQASGPLLYLL